VRNAKFPIFLAFIAAGALLAHAGSASQAVPPAAANPTPGAPQVAPAVPAAPAAAPLVIVIDPAHGDADPGAHGSTGIEESDVVLSFARQLRAALQAQGLRVVMTRDADVDPSFDDRSAIVNAQFHAIFLTLHVSSTGTPGTARVYSLPAPAPQTPAASAASSALLPPPVEQPNPHPGLRAWDNAQDSFVYLSRRFAELLQLQLAQRFRGSPEVPATVAVRQLRTIAAPAIAVEVSSISVSDRRQLDAMAEPLTDAVVRAIMDFEPLYVSAAGTEAGPSPPETAAAAAPSAASSSGAR
jgi:N-acetylmuramoyl-L-alanine amidase